MSHSERAHNADHPSYDGDLFDHDALKHPFEHYRAIRDLGPAVRIDALNVYAIGRYNDVREALRASEVLTSSQGIAFNEVMNAPMDRPLIIRSEGDYHMRLRSVLGRMLMPNAVKAQRETLKAMISSRITDLLAAGGTFDGVESIAQCLPLGAVTHLVGLPEDGRRNMLRWANAGFNGVGPERAGDDVDPRMVADRDSYREVYRFFASVDPKTFVPNSWAAGLFEAVDDGRLTEPEARTLLSGLVMPSLDTTINAKSSLLCNLARNPDQWRRLKAQPALISSAVLEGVRHSATVRWFSRVAREDYVAGDVFIPKGARVMVMYGSANRDERRYENPDEFDVSRNPTDQVGWGNGPHMCVGMHLAKLEMEVMLEALIEQVKDIEVGEPELSVSRGLYGFDKLPMRVH